MRNWDELIAYSATSAESEDLQERLRLYNVFLKLYEHHRGLLDEILDLENSVSQTLAKVSLPYVQGVMVGRQVYLLTNLLQGETQALTQPQQTWIIGRDPRWSLIAIQDIRLSRCHAAIRYVEGQGFCLVDLGSSNGSYVNGEPVRQAVLKDGDQVRLGSVAFTFFLCRSARSLNSLSDEMVERLNQVVIATASQDLSGQAIDPLPPSETSEIPTLKLYDATSGFMR
ncbi:MAG: FHA domain-containing protein [Synechococcales cyanobacterium M58_A2018_015]|nr:FHA domain-containing protein [Synechococcales cyanobacterium M58_A2018_015]